jgi:hypothetical protein
MIFRQNTFFTHLFHYPAKVANCYVVCVCDYRRGIDWILDLLTYLYTPLETASNYGAIADLHT